MHDRRISHSTSSAVPILALPDGLQRAAAFGIWTHDACTGELHLSATAAELLAVEPGSYFDAEECLINVAPEDKGSLMSTLRRRKDASGDGSCSFRVSTRASGLRWLRVSTLPDPGSHTGFTSGFLADITPVKLAEMRERFIFRFTQLLIGTHTIEEVIGKILPMVCINLGWDWGAYWTLNPERPDTLACRQLWHDAGTELSPFSAASLSTPIPVGMGLVGKVWSSAHPTWIEDMPGDKTFLRRGAAQESGLQSGYAFPVIHTAADGTQHRFGVLEFFSKLPRQPSAQLPLVSTAVGALVAQTVQRLAQEAAMRHMAQTDDMTGLANRSHFHQLVERACNDTSAARRPFGLLYIDLDRFKPINDAFGHEAGNVLLKAFAARLASALPPDSVAGRLGGDEFCVLLHAADFPAAAKKLGNTILRAARKPTPFNDCPLVVSASIGVSSYPSDGTTAAELLRNADAAMYRSKHNGRNCISFGGSLPLQTPALRKSSLVRRMTVDAELQMALQRGEFFLEYQPIADAMTCRPVAMEALIRWRRSNGEVMYPGQFIGVAEECGLIADIDRWVVEQACADLAAMQQAGAPSLRVSVNMAAPEFVRASLPLELLDLTRRAGIAPAQLCLELTERMVMMQPDKVIAVMGELRAHGFRISLDDFGTEHSSLSRLRNLPITSLKIDRSFIEGLPDKMHDRAIVRAMLELARAMDLLVVAEGIETRQQLDALRELGNPLVQGYFISRPVSLENMIALAGGTTRKARSGQCGIP